MQYTPSHEVERVIKDARAKGGAYVSVRLRGTGTSVKREIHDLLSRDWLNRFSPQDAALLAYADAGKISLSDLSLGQSSGLEKLPMICASYYGLLFLVAVTAPNIAGYYMRRESPPLFQFLVLLISFPIYTALVPLVSELYGSSVSRTLALGGFAIGSVVLAAIYLTMGIEGSVAFPACLSHILRCLASLAGGYLLGEAARFCLFSRRKTNISHLNWSLRFFFASMVVFSTSCLTFYQVVAWHPIAGGLRDGLILTQFVAAVPIVALFSVLAGRIVRRGAEKQFRA
ncbi:hypothetical protein ACVCIH_30400 [Burkholderia glumae]|uniref:hypothetical protein n=1 Tax=Burkholderia glumae TaxID=337 RepID=UPI002037379C|nr:hypothetical protein [Burkholderia glumae]MCM2496102.1 hypothetical protein [Burkholderia glumae]